MDTENKTDEGQPVETPAPETDAALPGLPDDITADLVGAMPEPSQHAIDAESEKQSAEREKWADLRDVDGNAFDPAIHKTDRNGDPTTTKLGKLIKRPGRKAGTGKPEIKSQLGATQGKQETGQPVGTVNREQAAANGQAAAALLITMGVVLGGDDFMPRKGKVGDIEIDEQRNLEQAFANYLIATGKSDLSPGWALGVAVAGYVLPRFAMESTKKRTKHIGARLYVWWHNRKVKKAKKAEEAARAAEKKES